MKMIGAARIECCVTRWANRVASQIPVDGQLMSASAAKDRGLIELIIRPDFGRMAFGGVVALAAWEPTAAALEL